MAMCIALSISYAVSIPRGDERSTSTICGCLDKPLQCADLLFVTHTHTHAYSRPGGALLGVVDLAEEVLLLVVVSELLQPECKDGPVDNEKNSEQTKVINSEPFAGSLGGDGSRGGKDGRDGTGNSGSDSLGDLGTQGSAPDEGCFGSKMQIIALLDDEWRCVIVAVPALRGGLPCVITQREGRGWSRRCC